MCCPATERRGLLMKKIITVANQKGGVGKTTTVVKDTMSFASTLTDRVICLTISDIQVTKERRLLPT